MSGKMTTLSLRKIKVFWNKDYDVVTSIHDVTNKILSRESNYIVDLTKVSGNSEISMEEVVINLILSEFDQKKPLF